MIAENHSGTTTTTSSIAIAIISNVSYLVSIVSSILLMCLQAFTITTAARCYHL